jgi:hypothetical protein
MSDDGPEVDPLIAAAGLFSAEDRREPTPKEQTIHNVIDRFLVLRDETNADGWPTQRLYLRFQGGLDDRGELLAEGPSLVHRRELYRTILTDLVIAAAEEVDGLQRAAEAPPITEQPGPATP